ncbi:hypothetical protein BaRGS_00017279 [Batillaria attramentaria]|uniref:TNFR-Cys domain-containing protein n=1 Tax=Batillaria attramentaria TaxID=370345 RepID=A0ABD0KWA8_9CAEN
MCVQTFDNLGRSLTSGAGNLSHSSRVPRHKMHKERCCWWLSDTCQFAAMGLSRFVVAAISLMITITSSTVASVIDVNAVSSSTQRNDVSASSRNDDAGRSDVSASRNDDAGSPDHFRPVQMLPECPAEHYFSSSLQACQPCSKCSDNLIIRRPCSALGDIVCGPFVEFSKFQQSSVLKSDVSRHGHHKGGEHHGEGRHENRAPDGSEVVPSLDAVSVMESQPLTRTTARAATDKVGFEEGGLGEGRVPHDFH